MKYVVILVIALIPLFSFAEGEKCGGWISEQCPKGTKCVTEVGDLPPWLDGVGTCKKESIAAQPNLPIWFGNEERAVKKTSWYNPLTVWRTKPNNPAQPTTICLKDWLGRCIERVMVTKQSPKAVPPNQEPCVPQKKSGNPPKTETAKDCALPASCTDSNGVITCRDPKDKKGLDECLDIDSSFLNA